MKRFLVILSVLLFSTVLFAQKASFVMKNGKTVSGKITKVEAGTVDSKNLSETSSLNAAQGTNELMIQISDIKEIVFKNHDDVSCFEDGRFVPVRKFCSMKTLYYIIPKTPSKDKNPIELTDDRVLFFHVEGQKEPVTLFFYKIQVSSEGREDKVDYPDLEREVMNFNKNGVKKITFN
ncbi:MAG TPA: hypothetical protein VLJ60_09105 [bacterium]|nr:hypothetical protein [bacterium]